MIDGTESIAGIDFNFGFYEPEPPAPPKKIKPKINAQVNAQWEGTRHKNRVWSVALCKTELGVPFMHNFGILWVFKDGSGLLMNEKSGALSDAYFDAMGSLIPLDNIGTPEVVADRYKRIFL